MSARTAVLVPGTLTLLPEYAGLEDPVADLRAAARTAVGWLLEPQPARIGVLGAPVRPDNAARGVGVSPGLRVARHLLAEAGFAGETVAGAEALACGSVLVVANGSATRTEKAPGHLDDRAHEFDVALGKALRDGDPAGLAAVDARVAEALWCHDAPALHDLARWAGDGPVRAEVLEECDPFGVAYWVVTWQCG